MKKENFPPFHEEFIKDHPEMHGKDCKNEDCTICKELFNPNAKWHWGFVMGKKTKVFARLEESPVFDVLGNPVYYGICEKCKSDTEDRGIMNGNIQLHFCYKCRTTNKTLIN